ncbi:MAG: S-layer homology domain-containing protein [Dialister micraerophilus]|uniref:S-layer homology domain-containing protein n=1 Tax=Dialister micraerophilus TaxID=309120 RepID=UPI00255183A7|nr:S-layer homology domain-containing protein [Dialister micraerophilus]MDK8252991.1 S-layer homology domain-containing protein [Dialister micraerophilus]
MKKILALAAVAALTAGVSAYAANPFSDVSTDHWAYQAVADLSAQGVVEGYPNGTFQGEKHITRYEVAQIVARLLAQESQLNAQQRATVEKLAAEYADELNNLGVRVSNLENKVGNVRWSGDARVKFERGFVEQDGKNDLVEKDGYTGRIRLNLKAQANDKIAVKARLVSNFDFVDAEGNGNISVDRLHAEYAPVEGLTFDLGRTSATLGSGAWYDDAFDGVIASYDNGMFNAQAGYGRARTDVVKVGQVQKEVAAQAAPELTDVDALNAKANNELYFVQGNVQLHEKVGVGAFYTRLAKADTAKDASAFYGVNGKVQLMDNVALSGDYVRNANKVQDKHPAFWDLGLEASYNMFNFGVRYVDIENGSYYGGSTFDMPSFLVKKDAAAAAGVTFWQATASVALAKNVSLDGYYNFDVKGKKYDKSATEKDVRDELHNDWGVSLNYVF